MGQCAGGSLAGVDKPVQEVRFCLGQSHDILLIHGVSFLASASPGQPRWRILPVVQPINSPLDGVLGTVLLVGVLVGVFVWWSESESTSVGLSESQRLIDVLSGGFLGGLLFGI